MLISSKSSANKDDYDNDNDNNQDDGDVEDADDGSLLKPLSLSQRRYSRNLVIHVSRRLRHHFTFNEDRRGESYGS